mmetsp:Transcript_97570/g.279007  ORF Transcript_97570/g.279007 Transcript_97570/m.279007 type:complete len:231 (+) Transcript_97570:164-856(+)
MGGGVSIPVPLSDVRQEDLKAKYAKFIEEGLSEEDINTKLTKAMPGLVVFDQIDCDHTGKVSSRELKRTLRALPRKKPTPPEGGWPDGKPPPFVPFDAMYETLDSDGDGEISLDEWLDNLSKLPGLESAINSAIDPATGKLKDYVSLEDRLAELVAKGDDATDEEKAKIESIRASLGETAAAPAEEAPAEEAPAEEVPAEEAPAEEAPAEEAPAEEAPAEEAPAEEAPVG